MQNLINFKVGGTIHVVVNNQIGFTTTPSKSRSGVYCTDIAKAIDAPIFHVNADSMDDVAKVFSIAAEYRQKFKEDVVIDLIGYRKYGHNELDSP
jgi:2-oxoglutarate dehydrogenase complex dehydrogenase (E1) component-like enzyme